MNDNICAASQFIYNHLVRVSSMDRGLYMVHKNSLNNYTQVNKLTFVVSVQLFASGANICVQMQPYVICTTRNANFIDYSPQKHVHRLEVGECLTCMALQFNTSGDNKSIVNQLRVQRTRYGHATLLTART